MEKIAETGKFSLLEVKKIVDFGIYLEAGDEEILLPKKYAPESVSIGDEISVFIYRDSEDRLIATTLKPRAVADQCAYLRVKDESPVGAFLDWGIAKDLLVPFREQKEKMRTGKEYLVYVYVDKLTDRVAATTKIGKYVNNESITVKEGEEVEVLICETIEPGIRVVVNNRHWGMLYKNEIFKPVTKGDRLKGFVKKIREEGKIDISLQEQGYDEALSASLKILKLLKEKDGYLTLTDKTDPKEIYDVLQMSKKTFKKAIGTLFKERKIILSENGIRLTDK